MITIVYPYGKRVDKSTIGKLEIGNEIETLGEAISLAERHFGIRVEPDMERDRYFRVWDIKPKLHKLTVGERILQSIGIDFGPTELGIDYRLADIHILRSGVEICPKQDVNFKLKARDQILFYIEILMC